MKTNKIIIGLLSVSALALSGCKDKMVELNTNPDTMQNADIAQLFVGATGNFGYISRGTITDKASGPMSLMQYLSNYTNDAEPYVNPKNPAEKSLGSWGQQYSQFFNSYQGQRLFSIVKWIDAQETGKAKYQDVRAICEILSVYQQWNILSNYGAMTYSEAFKGITEGITQPKYQKLQEVWQDLDVRLKAAIQILSAPVASDVYKLGTSDFFNGWANTPLATGGSSASEVGYSTQRAQWLKFGNMFRFEMAWMLAKVEPANFTKVSAEVLAVTDGLMTSVNDGTYFNYSSSYDNNPDDVDVVAQQYGVGESFVNTLKRLDDPRLPYLARPNGLCPELSPNFMAMQQYFPDSLAKYGDLMTGDNIYVGKNTSPRWYDRPVFDGEAFPGYISKTFNKLLNPNYPGSLSVTYVNNGDATEIVLCPANQKEFNLTVQVVSSSQARYFIKTGGKSDKNGPTIIDNNVNKFRFDGASDVSNPIMLLRRPIYTYAQQCFLFAVSGTSAGGKSPAAWYAEGIKAAMAELKDDALRYGIQVAVNSDYPKIPGTRLATIPYTYDADAEAAAMVTKSPYSAENAMAQAWVYFYNQPDVAYMWWLRTGLLPVKSHNNVSAAKAEAVPYLEEPYTSSNDLMAFPRRACLPNQNAVNVNFLPIKSALEADAEFGQWQNTAGRIWWDTK